METTLRMTQPPLLEELGIDFDHLWQKNTVLPLLKVAVAFCMRLIWQGLWFLALPLEPPRLRLAKFS